MENVTLESLATVAGATIAAGLIVQFVGVVVEMSARAKRLLSLSAGAIGVVGGTFILAPVVDAAVVVLAVFNGMIAGLAASQAYQTATKGIDASVEPEPAVADRFDEGYNPGDPGYDPRNL